MNKNDLIKVNEDAKNQAEVTMVKKYEHQMQIRAINTLTRNSVSKTMTQLKRYDEQVRNEMALKEQTTMGFEERI